MYYDIDTLMAEFAEIMWGSHLLILLIGGGLYFTIYCRLTPFRYVKHAIIKRPDSEKKYSRPFLFKFIFGPRRTFFQNLPKPV